MRTLVAQVKEQREDAEIEFEDVDGYNTYRRVSFDEQTSNWLEPIISLIGPKDRRIKGHFTSRGGMLIVDFVADGRAEGSEPFPIPQVEKVLTEEPEEDLPDEDVDVEARRKELNSFTAAELRAEYPEFEDKKKSDLIDAIIADEFYA
jgi:hypothetical protein